MLTRSAPQDKLFTELETAGDGKGSERTPSPPPGKISKRKSADAESPKPKRLKTAAQRKGMSGDPPKAVPRAGPSPAKDPNRHEEGKKGIIRKKKARKLPNDSEEDDADSEPAADGSPENAPAETAPPPAMVEDPDESSMSEVFDEPPPKKRQKKPKSTPPPREPKPSKAKTSNATAELPPDEAEIKKLQGWLVKCGVRKIWAIELKRYGDDHRAKIRHLREMLGDVGMDGRFSEAKAREIKERRELLQEVEAVQEWGNRWGVNETGRTSRAKQRKDARPVKYAEDSDDEDGEDGSAKGGKGRNAGDDNDDGNDGEPNASKNLARMRRARASLAFVDEDEESSDD